MERYYNTYTFGFCIRISGLYTYTISHSCAANAEFMGIPAEVINDGLGHNSSRTTEIYLKSFTNHVLDEGNEMVVSQVYNSM
ncbi:hypothetical protein MWU78_15880 [Arenibacter sp. F26102]|uniref:hypothetical protein n=1 Tax=Arenibacter sp. F26102 TaxID=2926416 RepID=UPI001FF4024D|nr:hypothetical protein [Arenibacter sp. F26102]MCK0147137.1 hypothetical protein [Arenibacter sp. F26102]